MTVVYLDRKVVLGGALALALAFVFGVVIGYFGKSGSGEGGMSGPMFERLVADKFVEEQQLVQQGKAFFSVTFLIQELREGSLFIEIPIATIIGIK